MDKKSAEIAKKFAKKIKKKFNLDKVILFGSRARGDNLTTSDYDFIIVGDYFYNKLFIFRSSEFYDFWKEPVDIEAICYTPEEFSRKLKERGIVREAAKDGIEL